jgi:hypothetical protein
VVTAHVDVERDLAQHVRRHVDDERIAIAQPLNLASDTTPSVKR